MRSPPGGVRERIYSVVRRIPRGRVATYGQVAELAGLPGQARQVGYALHALPRGSRVPWHRVINAAGAVSLRAAPGDEVTQRQLLESEGIVFDTRGRVPLARVRWRARSARRLSRIAHKDAGRLGA
ncbi:MAG: MGMT family protein [Gemmatimonadales bacterium]